MSSFTLQAQIDAEYDFFDKITRWVDTNAPDMWSQHVRVDRGCLSCEHGSVGGPHITIEKTATWQIREYEKSNSTPATTDYDTVDEAMKAFKEGMCKFDSTWKPERCKDMKEGVNKQLKWISSLEDVLRRRAPEVLLRTDTELGYCRTLYACNESGEDFLKLNTYYGLATYRRYEPKNAQSADYDTLEDAIVAFADMVNKTKKDADQ